MKPIAICSYLTFAALSLYAADPQASSKDTAAPRTTHTQTLFSQQSSGTSDSPLVRAARATNRLGKKPSLVITNDTLVRQGGHFTTTTTEAQQPLPATHAATPSPNPEQLAAETKRKKAEALAAAEKTRKSEEMKKNAAREGDAPYGEPPALESELPVLKPTPPAPMGKQKPPN